MPTETAKTPTKSQTTLTKTGSASYEPLPEVPDLRNRKAWLAQADSTHPVVAVSQVMDVAAPDAPADRISLLARLIAQRGYTAAELAYAAQELPFDDYLNSKLRYGKPIMPVAPHTRG